MDRRRLRLSYISFLARDVDVLARFYIDALGLEEIEASRDPRYREVKGGGCMIGFAYQGAREALCIADEPAPLGTRSLLTFDVGTVAGVAPAIDRAVAAGATLVRPALDTFFGQHQAVLRDPEGNLFRLSAAIGA